MSIGLIPKNNFNIENLLSNYISNIKNLDDFFVLQVGANDGKTNDPIYSLLKEYQLRGILLEPQKDIFEKLKENYSENKNIILVNAAISDQDGGRALFRVKNLTNGYPGLSSFNRETLRKNLARIIDIPSDVDNYIKETMVDTFLFDTLVAQYNIRKIDFLQIDCEGYDYEIIKLFDFNIFSPKIINYEYKHLSANDRDDCERLLESKGYKLFRSHKDTCALI